MTIKENEEPGAKKQKNNSKVWKIDILEAVLE